MTDRFVAVDGWFGWSNTRAGEEFYVDPDGRWVTEAKHPRHGALLYEKMNEAGVHEGSRLVVIGATTRFIDDDEFEAFWEHINKAVEEFEWKSE